MSFISLPLVQLAANSTNGHQGALNQGSGGVVERIENDVQRMKRTMHLLIFVGSGFCLCWLPLNVYNTVNYSYVFWSSSSSSIHGVITSIIGHYLAS